MAEILKPKVVDFRRGMETTREEQNDDMFSWRELLNAEENRAAAPSGGKGKGGFKPKGE